MGLARTADSLYPPRTIRTFAGKGLEAVGVAGSILMEPRGDRGDFKLIDDIDAEDVDDAFECVLLWNDRMEDTEDEVEFRPPRPLPDERR